jgi:hypothetical protein
LRIDKLRKELEEKLRKEQEIIDLKENYAKMDLELAEMKKKVQEAEGKADAAILKAGELEKKNEDLEKNN